jgi:hypothetical protein
MIKIINCILNLDKIFDNDQLLDCIDGEVLDSPKSENIFFNEDDERWRVTKKAGFLVETGHIR